MSRIEVGTLVKILHGAGIGEYVYIENILPFNSGMPGQDRYEVVLENGHREIKYARNLEIMIEAWVGDSPVEWEIIDGRISISTNGISVKVDNPSLPNDRMIFHLVNNTNITGVHKFAGKGLKRDLGMRALLVSKHGGDEDGWFKYQGNASVDENGTKLRCVLHWCEHPDVGAVERRIIRFYKN